MGDAAGEGRERAAPADSGQREPASAKERGNAKRRNRRRRAAGRQPIVSRSMIGEPVSLQRVSLVEDEFDQPYGGRESREASTRGHGGQEAIRRRQSRQVRRGVVGPPANFQHVAHLGLDPSRRLLPEDAEDRRLSSGSPPFPAKPHRKSHRWSTPVGLLDLQEAQTGSRRWPSLDGDSGQQLMREASANLRQKNNAKTREASSDLKRREKHEGRKQQQRQISGQWVTHTSRGSVDLSPPGQVRVADGHQQQQHSASGGLIVDPHLPAVGAKDCGSDSRAGDVMHGPQDDDRGHRWPSSPDGGQEECQSWTKAGVVSGSSRPVSPPPRGLRKDSIGPPTNFQHVLHVDRDSTDHELQQLMANLNKQGTPPLTAHETLPDLAEGLKKGRNSRSHRRAAGRLNSPPPAAVRKHMIGPPTDFQHVGHVGFGGARTAEEEAADGRQEVHQWSIPPPQDSSLIRKDMIGPPTNFQHLLHLDRDSPAHHVHRLLREHAGVDQQVLAESETQRTVTSTQRTVTSTDRVEEASGRSTSQTARVRKDMIGSPTNFQHVTHVGFSNDMSTPGSDWRPLNPHQT